MASFLGTCSLKQSRLALTKKDPRFQKKTFVSRNSVRDQKLADICDDMRCSVAEAVAFLDRGIAPCGW